MRYYLRLQRVRNYDKEVFTERPYCVTENYRFVDVLLRFVSSSTCKEPLKNLFLRYFGISAICGILVLDVIKNVSIIVDILLTKRTTFL